MILEPLEEPENKSKGVESKGESPDLKKKGGGGRDKGKEPTKRVVGSNWTTV